MVAEKRDRLKLEESSFIRCFVGWEEQTIGNLRKMYDVYGEACFTKKYVQMG